MNPPEFVDTVLMFSLIAAGGIGLIGLTGAMGVPLPWPFVPRWVVDIRKAKRARRRERRQARKRESRNRPDPVWETPLFPAVLGQGEVVYLHA